MNNFYIKKHKNKNEYICKDGLYIRNLCKKNVIPIDINNFFYTETDKDVIINNESINYRNNINLIENENLSYNNILIISDGFNFENFHLELKNLSKNVIIISTNNVLKKWKLVGDSCLYENRKAINYHFVNNPYENLVNSLPDHNYYPKCICSTRTNSKFIEKYKGIKYYYFPTENNNFNSLNNEGYLKLDDYRNPICGALSLSYFFEAKKIFLLGIDACFKEKKIGSLSTKNNLYCYETQFTNDKLIDSMCYWLKKENIKIAYNSFGSILNNAEYINYEYINNFFE